MKPNFDQSRFMAGMLLIDVLFYFFATDTLYN